MKEFTTLTFRLAACFALMATPLTGCGSPTGSLGDDAGPRDAGTGDGADAGAIDAGAVDAGADGGATNSADAGLDRSPIVAPADTWTWVDFPASRCASGTATGIGINPHAGATSTLIYFEGGGACTSANSCWGPDPGAANVAGYDRATFEAAKQRAYPILSRDLAANPFRAMNIVYVPYCTGDMHAGHAEVDLVVDGGVKPTYFWGGRDLELFLARVVPTFSGTTHVWAAGTSAGGFGTVLVFDQLAKAFGTRVDVIDDSGPSLTAKFGSDNSGLFAIWGYTPPCAGCKSHREVLAFNRQSQPNSRFAFLSFTSDPVISKDFGYTVDEYPAVLQTFVDSFSSDANAKYLLETNKTQHVLQSDPWSATKYLPWFTQMVNDDPAWASQTVAHP